MDLITNLFELFSNSQLTYLIFIAIFGLLVGSFLNVVIYRLPKMMEHEFLDDAVYTLEWFKIAIPDKAKEILRQPKFTLAFPPSTCPNKKCGHQIRAWENIPIISYFILLRGKCSNCNQQISLRYPFIEFLTAMAFILVALQSGVEWQAIPAMFIVACIIALTMIDIDLQILPDKITFAILWVGLISNYFGLFTSLESAVLGVVFGYGSLWTLYQVHFLLTKREGMGYGDFKMLAACGAWLGWEMLPLIVIMSACVGTLFGVWGIVMKNRGAQYKISFGPFLALGAMVAYFRGEQIIAWYFNASGI
jgi:leader peptidase (prepilin peptidase) / N-methyltransferase